MYVLCKMFVDLVVGLFIGWLVNQLVGFVYVLLGFVSSSSWDIVITSA